eukprot:TRINITY_DN10721_c0_g1_i2.p1 TRINITY_DN10721_c0_g1~~TRINITY_DN10721_c0_g1_i2.p1  ORF type:complete len:676 (+),score=180.41 TRINITY_DN10721_c0_g1_i2:1007-3034(+)
MSKATWAHRLPTPHPFKPVFHKYGSVPRSKVTGWEATSMENYEHVKGGMVAMKSPAQVRNARMHALQSIQADVLAGRPLWGLDTIQTLYEREIQPTHDHYREVLIGSVKWDEPQTAKDCWALMDRQGLMPDDKTLCCFFEVCAAFKLKDLALQAWNRYCNEFQFLEEGEEDPKPITRTKHTLSRDDHYTLPWWKKQWHYDPNEDIPDSHRYNRTRDIYSSAMTAMLACGEVGLADQILSVLEAKLPTTPTPIGEPVVDPNLVGADHGKPDEGLEKKQIRFRIPNIYLFTLRRKTRGIDWVPNHEWVMQEHQLLPSHPARSRDSEHGDPRFYTNEQYLIYSYEKAMRYRTWESKEELDAWVESKLGGLGFDLGEINWEDFVVAYLEKVKGPPGAVYNAMHDWCEEKALRPVPAMYIPVFKAFAEHGEGEGVTVGEVIKELRRTKLTIDLETHTAAMRALLRVGKSPHQYFVKNVLRSCKWGNEQISILLQEYRRIGDEDPELQKKHCERAYIWCGRYNIEMSEANKQYIEDDYDRIGVQVRNKEELLVWKMKRQHNLKESLVPKMPNPVMDRVTHTLSTSDHINPEHLSQWAVPYSNAGRSFTWEHSPHSAPATTLKDLTDINRLRYLPQKNLFSPWKNRNFFTPGAAGSYKPERTHEKLNINRWLEETNRAFPGN